MPLSRGDQGALRLRNRCAILNHLRRHGPTSRTQLVDVIGLSSAAITAITSELIDDHLLVERSTGAAGASGGRRPIYLDIDYGAHYAVGLQLREDKLEAVLTDLSTTILAQTTAPLVSHDPDDVATQIHHLCTALYAQAHIDATTVIGLGIALSGVIDALQGTVVHAPLLGWRDVHFAPLVRQRTGLPTHIDNDVNSLAAAERLFGQGKHAANFLTVALGQGLGSALVLNGELYRGRHGGAGEFGHNVVVPNGRPCSCGGHGCLEAYTAEPALLAQFRGQHPDLAAQVTAAGDLVTLAERGHSGAIDVLGRAGHLLGLHLSYLVNVVDPDLVIIAGEGTRLGPQFFTPLQQAMRVGTFGGHADDLTVVIDAWPDDFTPWIRGAASLAVQCAFDFGTLARGGAVLP